MALLLRKMNKEDMDTVMNWRMLPEVTKYMYTDPKLSRGGQQKWYRKVMDADDALYWIIQYEGVDIGLVYVTDIDRVNDRCKWAYYIADTSYRGKGIARQLECNIYDYAFEKLNLNKVCCEVLCNNEKVISIHEKFGAEIEGTRRQQIKKNGEYLDIVEMAILREKWRSVRHSYQYDAIYIENYKDEKPVNGFLSEGQSYSFSKTVTEADVALFAGVSGDFNPLHMDRVRASQSVFQKRVCHGMLVASYISTVIGNRMPGTGAVYLSQNLEFVNPTYIGDTVTASVTVKHIRDGNIAVLDTVVTNQDGRRVIEGEAVVKVGEME